MAAARPWQEVTTSASKAQLALKQSDLQDHLLELTGSERPFIAGERSQDLRTRSDAC